MDKDVQFLFSREIYEEFVLKYVLKVRKYLWIATANIKDLYIEYKGKYRPFLYFLSDLVQKGVEIRIVYAKEPGPNFQKDFSCYPNLIDGIEQMVCPRLHFKMIVVDGKVVYTGSANLTGAGIGAKSNKRRNFEFGFLFFEEKMIRKMMEKFDLLWIGHFCEDCQRKSFCGEYPFHL